MVTGAGMWGLLLASCLVLLALLALAALAVRDPQPGVDRRALRAEADELAAEAAAIAEAAAVAHARAEQARHVATAAEQDRDAAWQRQEAAGARYQQALRSARQRRPATAGAPTAPAQHQRDVSRAALTAYRRGEISVQQLRQLWRRAGDPDPAGHDLRDALDRAVDQHRAADHAARREHDVLAATARRAAETARIAEVAAGALAAEAVAAAAEADEAADNADRADRGRRRR